METKTTSTVPLAGHLQQQHPLPVSLVRHLQNGHLFAQPLMHRGPRDKLLSKRPVTENTASQFLIYSHPLCITTKDFI